MAFTKLKKAKGPLSQSSPNNLQGGQQEEGQGVVLHVHGEAIVGVSHKFKFHLYLTSYTMFNVPFVFDVIYICTIPCIMPP